ncbi:MAG: hypothetical protein KC483_10870 [Nitrosarchaeum sp.]|nr:hypothetical protein [Nitrosarchaeum sp.]
MSQLTEHFHSKEFIVSAAHPNLVKQIAWTPKDELKAFYFAKTILEPIRKELKESLIITSGKRNVLLNAAVGGVKTSDHRWLNESAACDFTFNKKNKHDLLEYTYLYAQRVLSQAFGQMIIYRLGADKLADFIHISLPTRQHHGELLVKTDEKFMRYEP